MTMLWTDYVDAAVACFNAKYKYGFWRPVTAIPARRHVEDSFPVAFPARFSPAGGRNVARSGGRFLVLNTTPPVNARDLSVVFNWPQLMGGGAQH
jgi:hypothetical protein